MRAYSLDLRERVVRALQSGTKQKEVAEQFDISLASVQRFAHQYRTQGNLQSKVSSGRKRCVSNEQKAQLVHELGSLNNPTVANLAKRWQEITGKYIAPSTIHKTLQRLEYTYKKTKISIERDEEKRKDFREQLETIDPKRLVFLDECGFSLALFWLYGWAIKSKRCVETVPCQRGVNRSLVGAISLSGMIAFASKTGGYKRDDFETFLSDKLLPKLAAGSVLVMDNARITGKTKFSPNHGGKIEELVTDSSLLVMGIPNSCDSVTRRESASFDRFSASVE